MRDVVGYVPSGIPHVDVMGSGRLLFPGTCRERTEAFPMTIHRQALPGRMRDDPHASQILGESSAIREVRRLVVRFAPSDAPLLITGEPGTGKELVARAIHAMSGRCSPFMAANCGAVPENLAESTLFGHVKGAFTGAVEPRRGLFSTAAGGTLFLDEVGELPSEVQAKLLRAQARNVVPARTNPSLLPVGPRKP